MRCAERLRSGEAMEGPQQQEGDLTACSCPNNTGLTGPQVSCISPASLVQTILADIQNKIPMLQLAENTRYLTGHRLKIIYKNKAMEGCNFLAKIFVALVHFVPILNLNSKAMGFVSQFH